MSDYKLGYAITYLQELNADDAFCAQLLENYNNSEDKGEFVPFDEAAAMCGVNKCNTELKWIKRAVKVISKQPKLQRERIFITIYKLSVAEGISKLCSDITTIIGCELVTIE